MTGDFNFISYMREKAEKLKDLQHTDDNPHFTRIKGIADLEEFLQKEKKLQGFQLAAVSSVAGRFVGGLDNTLDQAYYAFHILKRVSSRDFDEQETAIRECEDIAKNILARMFLDQKQANSPLMGLMRSSISYNQSGPWVHNWHGIMVSFIIQDYPGLVYNVDDWIDG